MPLPDRGEMMEAGRWLHAYYQSDEGLQRPEGLWINGEPDWEGIGAWLFDVYLTARIGGATSEQARAAVVQGIQRTDEWRQKHPRTEPTGLGLETSRFVRDGRVLRQTETRLPDRGEMMEAGRWLHAYYRSDEGLQRPEGLWINGEPDWEGIGAWLFDVYLRARIGGATREQARAAVVRGIERSDEWRQKHPPPPPTGGGSEHGRLVRDGLVLRQEDDRQTWFGVGVTAFPLLQRWLDHDVDAVARFLDWMIGSGLGVARALGMYQGGVGRFHPQEYGEQYFTDLDALLSYMAERGLRLKLSVFADCQQEPLREIDQPRFFARVAEVMAPHWNAILDGGNEYPKNGWDPARLPRPGGVLASRGSNLSDFSPPVNPWDFGDVHPDRSEFERKFKHLLDDRTGNNVDQIAYRVPLGIDEGIGIGDVDEPGRTTADPAKCFDFAAGVRLMAGAFQILHLRRSVSALDLPPADSPAQRCIDASVLATRLMPPDFGFGTYTRGGPGAPPTPVPLVHRDRFADGQEIDRSGSLRTFGMLVGDRGACLVVSPGPAWGPVTQKGWRIAELRGLPGRGNDAGEPLANIVIVER